MKKYLLALLLLLPSISQAQIITTPLPTTLINGTLADANQVMGNFNAIVTGVNTNGAKNGANSDITSLSALIIPITPGQGGANVYIGAGSGAANAQLVVTPTPTNFTLVSGYTVNFLPSISNTSALTLSVAGTTAKAVLRQTSIGLQPLVGGEVFIGQMATVIYDGTQFELINSAISANVQPCTSIDYAGITVPTGYLAQDGSAQSRTTFATLFACLSNSGVAATTTGGSGSVAVAASAGYQIGWYVGGANVTCNTTIISKADGTHITLNNNAGASGATTLTIGPYPQGDCATTFNLPNFQGRDTVMADTTGGTLSSSVCTNPSTIGSRCGQYTRNITLATGNLPSIPYTPTGTVGSNLGGSNVYGATIPGVNLGYGGGSSGASLGLISVSSTFTGDIVNLGNVTPAAITTTTLQPLALVTKAIKF